MHDHGAQFGLLLEALEQEGLELFHPGPVLFGDLVCFELRVARLLSYLLVRDLHLAHLFGHGFLSRLDFGPHDVPVLLHALRGFVLDGDELLGELLVGCGEEGVHAVFPCDQFRAGCAGGG
jgi:hypothetical protein